MMCHYIGSIIITTKQSSQNEIILSLLQFICLLAGKVFVLMYRAKPWIPIHIYVTMINIYNII